LNRSGFHIGDGVGCLCLCLAAGTPRCAFVCVRVSVCMWGAEVFVFGGGDSQVSVCLSLVVGLFCGARL